MRDPAEGVRRQIFRVVASSRFAKQQLPPGGLPVMAKQIGVSVDLLEEVRFAVASGKLDASGIPYNRIAGSGCQFRIPIGIKEKLTRKIQQEYHTTLKAFSRTLLHYYLCNTWEPEYVDTWHCSGEREVTTAATSVSVHATDAFHAVFNRRAARQKSSMSRIYRSLVMTYLNAELPWEMRIVTRAQLYQNEEDYIG